NTTKGVWFLRKIKNNKHKLAELILSIIKAFIIFYIMMYIARFFFDSISLDRWGILALAIGMSLSEWTNKCYPTKPPQAPDQPEASLRDTIKKYTVHGSRFHRRMVAIYAVIILMAVGAYIYGLLI